MITPVSGARQGTHSPKKVEKFEGNLSDPCIQLPRKKPAVSEETAGSCSGFGMCVTGCGSLGEVVIQEAHHMRTCAVHQRAEGRAARAVRNALGRSPRPDFYILE